MAGRFRDGGETLRDFGDEVLVRCPSCDARAVVRSVPDKPNEPGAATLSCGACGLSRRLPEPASPPRDRRCPRCERWIPVASWKPLQDARRPQRQEAACPRCGNVVRAALEVGSTVVGLPVDPYFREPLWLQASFQGELLWAWNARHLELLMALVAAPLRERTPGKSRNGTLLSRLPRWMKVAKHRNAVLATLHALRGRVRG
jgi:hypothetical protein